MVSGTAESQIGSRAVRRVLASSSTAIPIAVGLARDREKGEYPQTLDERLSTVRFMPYPSSSYRERVPTGGQCFPHKHPLRHTEHVCFGKGRTFRVHHTESNVYFINRRRYGAKMLMPALLRTVKKKKTHNKERLQKLRASTCEITE